MTKKEFINQYEIKDALPIDPSKKAMPAEGFAAALKDFLEEKFRGAIRINCDKISAQSILISAEYAAYFFKLLLTDIYARQLLELNLTSNQHYFIMTISADEPLLLEDRELRDLIRVARNSGMEIFPDDCSLRLVARLSPAMIRRIYAASVVDGKQIMQSKLCEIFFSGEVLSNTEDVDVLSISWKSQASKSKRKSK